jgi:nucleoside phosphorylase
MSKLRKVVCIQVAMKEEGIGFAEKLKLEETEYLDRDFGFREFRGTFGANLDIHLFLQGTDERFQAEQVGLEPAAVCATLILKTYRPDILMNFGTAGSFSKAGFGIGESVLIESPVRFHDRRVPLPGYFDSQVGGYPVAKHSNLKMKLGIKGAQLSSGSSLEMSKRDEEVLIEQNADMKEMEGAAIAWVASKMKVPFLSIKSVTDIIDSPEKIEEQFLKNLHTASKNVQDVSISALEFLDSNLNDDIWSVG